MSKRAVGRPKKINFNKVPDISIVLNETDLLKLKRNLCMPLTNDELSVYATSLVAHAGAEIKIEYPAKKKLPWYKRFLSWFFKVKA